jgi:hypothetical protein
MAAVVVVSAGGRSKAEYTVVLGFRSGDDTSRGWLQRHLGRGVC